MGVSLSGRHFLKLLDFTPEEIRYLLDLSKTFKDMKRNGIPHDYLKGKLLETGDAILAECARSDKIWGIGLSMHDKDRFDMSKWTGKSLLGFALMMVRDELKKV